MAVREPAVLSCGGAVLVRPGAPGRLLGEGPIVAIDAEELLLFVGPSAALLEEGLEIIGCPPASVPYPAEVGVGCLLPARLEGGNGRDVGESLPLNAWRVEELEVFRLCIDLEVAMRRRDSVPEAVGVP